MTSLALRAHTAPAEAVLWIDTPCLRCGYNLRTLPGSANCPECALPVASSLDRGLLRYSDPAWTTILAFSIALMTAGTLLELPIAFALALDAHYPHALWSVLWIFAAFNFFSQLFWIGAFLLCSPETRASSRQRRWFTLRMFARITSLVAMICSFFIGLRFSTIGVVIELIATAILMAYLLHLARRGARPSLIRHAWISLVAVVLANCIVLCTHIFSDYETGLEKLSMAGGWFVVLSTMYFLYVLYLFRRTFLASAAFARRFWYFVAPLPEPHE
jgi:hypothetical protein